MVELIGISVDSQEIELNNISEITVNQDENVPADDLSAVFAYKKDLPEIDRIILKDNGKTLFTGVVDEQQTIINKNSVCSKIIARSMAAVLLDNESVPVNYTQPSASVIFKRHIEPFGITKFIGSDVPIKETLKIPKGATNWQAAAAFSKKAFGAMPRVDSSGVINFSGIESESAVVFSNVNGVGYNSIKENNKRCKLLSDIWVKLKTDGSYTLNIINKEAKLRAIKRERYLDASPMSVSPSIADVMIDNSNKASYELVIISPERLLNVLGAKSALYDELIGERTGLYISSVYYRFSSEGEFTTVTLKKEN